jgi:hypothetical protein
MKNDLNIVPFDGPSNGYFLGIDPVGYDHNVAVFTVMKMGNNNKPTEIITSYKGRPNEDFKAKVQEVIDLYKINEYSIFTHKPD